MPPLRIAATGAHHYHECLYGPMGDRVVIRQAPLGPFGDPTTDLADVDLVHIHWPEWIALDDLDLNRAIVADLRARDLPVVWTAHNLTPHDKRPAVYDPIYELWAGAVDAVIHHSAWGEDVLRNRYRFGDGCRHVVIPHGHYGDLWTLPPRAEAEAELGLGPAALRIGLVGAPRAEKLVGEFLAGVVASVRTDFEVVCWSLRIGEEAPVDPRIVIAKTYRQVSDARYGLRLATLDLLALPFDPEGEMLGTGTVADALGVGLPALVSDWGYLTETMGPAGIACGHTAESVAACLDGLTTDAVTAARDAAARRRTAVEWGPLAERTLDLFRDVAARRR